MKKYEYDISTHPTDTFNELLYIHEGPIKDSETLLKFHRLLALMLGHLHHIDYTIDFPHVSNQE